MELAMEILVFTFCAFCAAYVVYHIIREEVSRRKTIKYKLARKPIADLKRIKKHWR